MGYRAKRDLSEQYSEITQWEEVSLLENWLKISAIAVWGHPHASNLKSQRAFRTCSSGLPQIKKAPSKQPEGNYCSGDRTPWLLLVYQSYAWKEWILLKEGKKVPEYPASAGLLVTKFFLPTARVSVPPPLQALGAYLQKICIF